MIIITILGCSIAIVIHKILAQTIESKPELMSEQCFLSMFDLNKYVVWNEDETGDIRAMSNEDFEWEFSKGYKTIDHIDKIVNKKETRKLINKLLKSVITDKS
jgi:hypothetical protein